MGVPQTEWLVDHEWEADRLSYCGSVPGIVNAIDHLWRVSLGLGEESTRLASSQFVRPPSGSSSPNPGLGASGFIWRRVLPGWTFPMFMFSF
jgi:hypothetical protein